MRHRSNERARWQHDHDRRAHDCVAGGPRARGGLVDEEALYQAIKSGKVAGAALDVFEQEPPPTDHPLLSLDEVIVTPHLGASTTEAQEGVAFTVAEQMRDYLQTGALRGAVNVPAISAKESAALQPYLE